MVGSVLEANNRWDIGNEVISCISKDFPGVLPIRPKVSIFLLLPVLVMTLQMLFSHNEYLGLHYLDKLDFR